MLLSIAVLSYFSMSFENPINTGYIGTSFLLLVLYAGSLKKGSKLHRRLTYVRKEYSIFGMILLAPHVLLYLVGKYQQLEWNGIISYIIMIPLFITSFILIRKNINNGTWKKLHTTSYIAYILMFTHLLVVSSNTNRYVYLAIIASYILLKIKNTRFAKLDSPIKRSIIITSLLITIALNVYASISINHNTEKQLSDDNTELNNTKYKDGVYSGEATGYKKYVVKVNVEVKNDKIVSIDVIDFGGTSPKRGMNFEKSVDNVKDKILTSNSTDVDTISGATYSTTGLINAVNNALKKAIK